jgi:hypothetical protein
MLAAFGSASGLFGNGQRLLVAGIHETAVMAGRREIWVVDRHPVGLAIEVSEQARVRPELFRTSAELSHVTDHACLCGRAWSGLCRALRRSGCDSGAGRQHRRGLCGG